MSVLRGRPPGIAAGMSGPSTPHSASVKLLGKPVLPRRYVSRCWSVQMAAYSLSCGKPESRNLDGIKTLLGQALSRQARRFGSSDQSIVRARDYKAAVGRNSDCYEERGLACSKRRVVGIRAGCCSRSCARQNRRWRRQSGRMTISNYRPIADWCGHRNTTASPTAGVEISRKSNRSAVQQGPLPVVGDRSCVRGSPTLALVDKLIFA